MHPIALPAQRHLPAILAASLPLAGWAATTTVLTRRLDTARRDPLTGLATYSKPYQLRWRVGTLPKAESFLTKGLAESRRAQLITAARAGEPCDEDTGLPVSLLRKDNQVTWYQHARQYIEMKW
ncbi:hypothetical protein AB0761_21840 [Peterkaempfera sp. SMS 1(5)a]